MKIDNEKVTTKKQELLDAMPYYYSEIPEVDAIMAANAGELERIYALSDDLLAQMYINTATWGLESWERIFNIPPAPRESLEFRRGRILARFIGAAPATKANLLAVIKSHTRGASARIVEFNSEYRFIVEVNLEDLTLLAEIYRDVEELKPAHLEFDVTGVVGGFFDIIATSYSQMTNFPIVNIEYPSGNRREEGGR